jgi:peptidoglycan-associated lipoprotein
MGDISVRSEADNARVDRLEASCYFRKMLRGAAVVLALVTFSTSCSSPPEESPPPVVATVPPPVATQPAVVATGDAVLEGDRIKTARPIYYDTAKHTIRPESFPVLDAVANVVAQHPEIKALIVEGHTDNQGDFQKNKTLSEERANAVVAYLAANLVPKGNKTAMRISGFGNTSPMCFTPDDACLQLNRRVEFRVER